MLQSKLKLKQLKSTFNFILNQLLEENGDVWNTMFTMICNVHVNKLSETVWSTPEVGRILVDLRPK